MIARPVRVPLSSYSLAARNQASLGPMIDPDAQPPDPPVEHPADIWSLYRYCPAATNAFYRDKPVAVSWHFQLSPA